MIDCMKTYDARNACLVIDHGGDGEDEMHVQCAHTLDPSLWISMKSSFKEKCTTFANHYFENLNFYSNLFLT